MNNQIKKIKTALNKIFNDWVYRVLAISLALNFLSIDYVILSQSTTFRILFNQNTLFYNLTSITLSLLIAVLFAISSIMLIYIFKQRRDMINESAPSGLFGTVFGAVASGCPVCGAWLLPLIGVAGSLAVFPLQGLDIKLLAIALLAFSIYRSSGTVLGICDKNGAKDRAMISVAIIVLFIGILFALPMLPQSWKVQFQKTGVSTPTTQVNSRVDLSGIYDQVTPKEGYTINAKYGNIGYELVQSGAIDFEQFKAIYDRAGQPLSSEQYKIFSKKGLDKQITINRENAYFLLNLFWAFGLANNNPIITEGEITKYGDGQVGAFASTGGWTIASRPLEEFMAKSELATLTPEQQAMLQRVAESVYRPCCNNSTAFPDCNHGMALLGILELMAAGGATEDEMYEAAKYFNAYWFPPQMADVATYFLITEGTDFKDVDPRVAVSKQFFSGRGWSNLKGWLNSNTDTQNGRGSASGGGCGV